MAQQTKQDFEEIRIKVPKKTRHEIRHWTRDREDWKSQEADKTLTRFRTRISVKTPREAKGLYYSLGWAEEATDPNATVGSAMDGANGQMAKAMRRIKKELRQEAEKQGVDVTEESYR